MHFRKCMEVLRAPHALSMTGLLSILSKAPGFGPPGRLHQAVGCSPRQDPVERGSLSVILSFNTIIPFPGCFFLRPAKEVVHFPSIELVWNLFFSFVFLLAAL